ncbi:Uncharacterised protein [Bordetella ansorpii]|uniref:PAP2 superfamily n=1 Tax=Bordetella ansorpii TaxID=288768 RepID=A0A157SBF2_9BORD|nr:hypothetical protein [Bordetella ansorpii]SAI67758.1 Uncharacterised protein [Bordetella ansorpii]
MPWSLFTLFGNAVFLVPLGALVCFQIFRQSGVRAGVVWMLAFGAGMLAVAVSKILFYGWGIGVPSLDLTCFSGHTFLALTVWPFVSLLTLQGIMPRLAWLPGVALGLLVACSRVGVGAHSVAEVVAGGGLALSVLAATQIAGRPRPEGLPGIPNLLLPLMCALPVVGLAFAVTSGRKLPTEHYFSQIGISLSGADQPMSREKWLRRWEDGLRH